MKNKNIKLLIISILALILVSTIGSLFTGQTTNSEWYNSVKPSITPPGWAFPIAWTILYILIAISLYLALRDVKTKQKTKIIILFTLNLISNALWSLFYFRLQNPILAFLDLLVIWITIILLIKTTSKINKTSAWLLIPYLAWVSFAGILNFLSI